MAQPEQANSRESGLHDRAEIKAAFEKLVSEHRESLHEEDRRAILKTVEGDFDVSKAKTLLETLPKNLADGKKRYDDLRKAYGDAEYGPLLREKFGEMSQMTFQKKVEAEEAIARAKKIDIQMKVWEIAGIIAPANRRFKLGYFIGLPEAEQKRIQNSLASTLNIEDRKHTLDRFLKLPESLRKEHFKNFRELSEEQRKPMLEKLEKEIAEKREKYTTAYRKKMESMQKTDAHGLSLFSTRSVDLYMKWFSSLPVTGEKSMETYLAHSDLDNPERSIVRDQMARLLGTVTDPKKRAQLQKEFNEADLEKRKEILAKGIPKDEKPTKDVKEKEPSALAKGAIWLQEKLHNLHFLPRSDEARKHQRVYAIGSERAERKRRAELLYQRTTTEGLQEAVKVSGKEMAEKTVSTQQRRFQKRTLVHHVDEQVLQARELKPKVDDQNAIDIGTEFVSESGTKLSTQEFQHTELKKMEAEVQQDITAEIQQDARAEGIATDEKMVAEAVAKKDFRRFTKDSLRHAT